MTEGPDKVLTCAEKLFWQAAADVADRHCARRNAAIVAAREMSHDSNDVQNFLRLIAEAVAAEELRIAALGCATPSIGDILGEMRIMTRGGIDRMKAKLLEGYGS